MPLRDHFHPPLDDLTSWEGFHGQWPAVIVQHLRKRLPPGYIAEPRVHHGSQVEIDVAAFEKDDAPRRPRWARETAASRSLSGLRRDPRLPWKRRCPIT